MTAPIDPARVYVQDYSTNVLHYGNTTEQGALVAYCNRRYQVYSVGAVGDAAADKNHGARMGDEGCGRCHRKQSKALARAAASSAR